MHRIDTFSSSPIFCLLILSVVALSTSCAFIPNQTATLAPALLHRLVEKNHRMSLQDKNVESSSNGLVQVRKRIARAISIGAPAYNAGDIDECTRVYQATALEIVDWMEDIPSMQENLKQTIAQVVSNSQDSKANAWALRGQFDAILEYQPPFTPETDQHNYELDPFTERMLPSQPIVVNDNVMGGVSLGGWNSETRMFSGSTSLANNGGFASLRWRVPSLQNWSYAKGIYLKGVEHDNLTHTFRIIIKDALCEQVRLSNYKAIFANPSGKKDSTIFIPFTTFDQMEQMGRPVAAPAFNPAAVTELGIMAIKPTVIGDFSLRIAEWGLYI